MIVGNHKGEVKIGSSTYNIYEQNDLQRTDDMAQIKYNDKQILLQSGYPRETLNQSLCHEIVHGFLREMEENELDDNEKLIDLFSKQIFVLLNENDINKLLGKKS